MARFDRRVELNFWLQCFFFCGCGEDNNMELTRANEFRTTHTNTRAKREREREKQVKLMGKSCLFPPSRSEEINSRLDKSTKKACIFECVLCIRSLD